MPPESFERPLEGDSWRDNARCRGMGTYFFFNPLQRANPGLTIKRARSICIDCPVTEQCLDEGVAVYRETGFAYGVWGGMSPKQIKAIARDRRED
mgnify:FL=1